MPPTTLIGLNAVDAADPAIVGTKFARLSAVHQQVTVPPAWCVPAAWFDSALAPDRLEALSSVFHDLTTMVGSELAGLDARLADILRDITLPEELVTELRIIADGRPLAVRSSTSVEDGHRRSHAGLYESFLHLRDFDQVCGAVLACWRSFYAPRAVVARLREGDHDPAPRMGVIIQHMVDAALAGVVFTHDTSALVSATIGTGENLLAGTADAPTFTIDTAAAAPPPYDRVALVAADLKRGLGQGEVDVEWAWNSGDGLAVLQVRPVTVDLPGCVSGPHLAAASLYFSDHLPAGVQLGACAQLYAEITDKRSALFRLAVEHGLSVGDGWVVTLNGAGLAALRPPWSELHDTRLFLNAQVVVDAGAVIRQNIVPVDRIEQLLETALNLRGAPEVIHTVLVRRFVQGRTGALTRRREDGTTALHHSAQGLVAINRGLAVPSEEILPPMDDPSWDGSPTIAEWKTETLRDMVAFTVAVDSRLPGACLEWVLTDQGRPHFVDYTASVAYQGLGSAAGRTMSAGSASGPLLRVEDSSMLERLSVAPIISIGHEADVPDSSYIADLRNRIAALPAKPLLYASRPYVILSRLIDDVAGMVFDGGSTMCHLAILLREAGLPAVIAPGFDIDLHEGRSAVIGGGLLRLIHSQV